MDNIMFHIPDWANVATVSTPTASSSKIYPKSDGWYVMDDTGTESKVVVGVTNGLLSAENGLTYSGDIVSLGGLLNTNTTIDGAGVYSFNVDNLDPAGYHLYQIDFNTGINISQGYTTMFDWNTNGFVELGAGNSYFDLLGDQSTWSVGSSGGRIILNNTSFPGERISMLFGNATNRFVMQRNASADAHVGTNNGNSKAAMFLNTSGCTISAGVTNSVIIAAQNVTANDPYTLYSNNIVVDNIIGTTKLFVNSFQINPTGATSGQALVYDGSSFSPQSVVIGTGSTGYVPLWNGVLSLTSSSIYEASGNRVGVGTTNMFGNSSAGLYVSSVLGGDGFTQLINFRLQNNYLQGTLDGTGFNSYIQGVSQTILDGSDAANAIRLRVKGNTNTTLDIVQVYDASNNPIFYIRGDRFVTLTGTFSYVDGNQAAGKVLTSDTNGVATWQTPVSAVNKYSAFGMTFSGAVAKTVTHNLGTASIAIQLWDVNTGEAISGLFNNRTSTTVDITLSATFSSPGVDVVILG